MDEQSPSMDERPTVGPVEEPQPPPPRPQAPPYWVYRSRSLDPLGDLFRLIKTLVWSSGFLAFLVMLVTSTVIIIAMTPTIQGWITTPVPLEDDPTDIALPKELIFVIFPFPVLLFELQGPAFQAWHFVILILFLASFSLGLFTLLRSWLSKRAKALLSLTFPEEAKSGLESVGKLFMATTSVSFIYFIVLGLAGVVPETPGLEELCTEELLYSLFSASVFEELISRVLLIGLPLLLLAVALKWERPRLKFLVGGGMRMNKLTLVLILFSASVFAVAHVYSWDLWKVPQVLVSGLALAYVFVRHGLYASILLHFSVNLSSSMLEIWPDNLVIISILVFSFLIWIAAGSYFFIHYLRGFILTLQGMFAPRPAPAADAQPPPGQTLYDQAPPQQAYNPDGQGPGFVCPNCGSVSATYQDGELRCLRCGQPHRPEQ